MRDTPPEPPMDLPWEVTPSLAFQLCQADPDVLIVDVREPWEWDLVHLPQAYLLPLGQLMSAPLEEKGRLLSATHILTLCHHGVRSRQAASWLRQQGFKRTQSIRGGIEAWAGDVDPTLVRY